MDIDDPFLSIEITAPAAWASYIINGDDSGLEDDEIAECDAMVDDIMSETGKAWCVGCSEVSEFRHRPDYGMSGDCLTYTFHRA